MALLKIIALLISLILAFSAGFIIGKHIQKNLDECKNSYDSGWNDCLNYIQENYEVRQLDRMLDDISKENG